MPLAWFPKILLEKFWKNGLDRLFFKKTYFSGVYGYFGALTEACEVKMYGVAFLDMKEMEWSSKLGLSNIIEAPRYDLTTFQEC